MLAERAFALESVVGDDTASVGRTIVTLRAVAPARLTLDSIPSASYRSTLQVTHKE